MKYNACLPEKKVLGYNIVNYSVSNMLSVFFVSLFLNFFVFGIISSFIEMNTSLSLIVFTILTMVLFTLIMILRNYVVRNEIKEGIHDPIYGEIIKRQKQRKCNDKLF